MLLEQPDLNIHVVAATREALMEELQSHIAMLWDEYAADDASNLSPMALELRTRLLAASYRNNGSDRGGFHFKCCNPSPEGGALLAVSWATSPVLRATRVEAAERPLAGTGGILGVPQ